MSRESLHEARKSHPPQPYKKNPLISVIIPTYNSEKYLAQAIESVLAQTYHSCEIIVIDDGSTDSTKERLREFHGQIQYLYQNNRGPSAARNAGIRVAQGAYVCFLDADDLWTPDKLQIQVEFLEDRRDIALVFSSHQEFNADGMKPRFFLEEKKALLGDGFVTQVPVESAFMKLLSVNFISTPTIMVRRQCLEKVGLFDESLWAVEDRDMWLRIAANFPIACVDKILCRRRVHHANISKRPELALRGRIKVLEINRQKFPHLAPAALWHKELADSYCVLGYDIVVRGKRWEALQCGFSSLAHAVLQMGKNSTYSWPMGFWLIMAALMGRRLSQSFGRLLKHLFASK